jgi:hypothetical protein
MLFSLHILLPLNTLIYILPYSLLFYGMFVILLLAPRLQYTNLLAYGWFQLGLLKVLGLNSAQED